jgi:uncharacterized protein (DUF488 family)
LTPEDSRPLDRQSPVIYTIGHSTRSLDKFVALLDAHGVRQLGDIRTVPRSRRHPHFAIDALSVSLPRAGIAYRHFPGLGGLRKPRADSPNTAWRHSGFRGYADYMATPAFGNAIERLLEFASASASGGIEGGAHRTAIMCAEAVWWRCHRQLVADALVARGVEVRHISTDRAALPHELTDFARMNDGKVSYPSLIR